jgi:hypothetical protein
MLVPFTCLVSAAWLEAQAQTKPDIITFDAPGAGTAAGQGTFGLGMTPSQAIEGFYIDSSNASHGFIRAKGGAITTFDAPGAGAGAGQGTFPESINPAGAITGFYTDATGLSHGFVRAPDGGITTFDAPGAGRPVSCSPPLICSNGTQGAAINPAGVIAGQYADTRGVFHGFLRSPDGSITPFDVPGAGTSLGQGTLVVFTDGINQEGAIGAGFVDANNVLHSAIRFPDGSFVTFDAPGAGTGPFQGTDEAGINPVETVMGFFIDSSSVFHGYVRAPDGTFTLVDVPGAGTGPGQGTQPFNINAPGDIAGAFIDPSSVNHGFLRTKSGAISTFDVSGAGTGSGQGTIPICNNPADAISGFDIDASGVAHGFLRTP